MHKVKGAISKNTLSLRFMQNAARALHEEEVAASKAKIRTEEEWELPEELWGGDTQMTDNEFVIYEPSYLPFLFPGFARSSTGRNVIDINGIARENGLTGQYQGRRKMAKQIEEEMHDKDEEDKAAVPPSSSKEKKNKGLLPKGARSISRSTILLEKPRPSRPSAQEFVKPKVESPQSRKRTASEIGQERKPKKNKEEIESP